MEIGFTTLAMFMDDNLEIIKAAHENNFEMNIKKENKT